MLSILLFNLFPLLLLLLLLSFILLLNLNNPRPLSLVQSPPLSSQLPFSSLPSAIVVVNLIRNHVEIAVMCGVKKRMARPPVCLTC
jgi:hypothetical protein